MKERFITYQLEGVLKAGSQLILNTQTLTLTLLSTGELIEQQTFTDAEYFLLEPLLEKHPEEVPYAVLLSGLTGEPIEHCAEKVQRALREKRLDEFLKPMRTVLTRVRNKLRPFGIGIKTVYGTGCQLRANGTAEESEAQG